MHFWIFLQQVSTNVFIAAQMISTQADPPLLTTMSTKLMRYLYHWSYYEPLFWRTVVPKRKLRFSFKFEIFIKPGVCHGPLYSYKNVYHLLFTAAVWRISDAPIVTRQPDISFQGSRIEIYLQLIIFWNFLKFINKQ